MSVALTIGLSAFALVAGVAVGIAFSVWLVGKVLGHVVPDFLKKL